MKRPEVYFDKISDVLYIVAKKGEEEEFMEVAKGVNVELDRKKNVIGIEILDASKFLALFVKKARLKKI